jgi:hypothetical protein
MNDQSKPLSPAQKRMADRIKAIGNGAPGDVLEYDQDGKIIDRHPQVMPSSEIGKSKGDKLAK